MFQTILLKEISTYSKYVNNAQKIILKIL